MEKLTYSVKEAAAVLGISPAKMYELVRSAGFPSLKLGKRLLVSRRGLENWIAEREGGGAGRCDVPGKDGFAHG